MTYSCVIIDDEPLAHDVLIEYISRQSGLVLQGQYYNGVTAAKALAKNSADILFLDIQMPEMDGISFLHSLEKRPVTIITTAYRDYAAVGFDLGVLDYLVKPIRYERFDTAVSRAIEFIRLLKNNSVFIEQNNGKFQQHFTIKSGTKLLSVSLDTITHIQGLKDYAIIHTRERKIVVKGYIKHIESILPQGFFTRVHKSFIVANDKIRSLDRNRIEFDNYQVPVGRRYKTAVTALLDK